MDAPAPIALWLLLIMADGSTQHAWRPQQSTDACWQAARAFLLHRPADYGGGVISLGAGCVVHPTGRSTER